MQNIKDKLTKYMSEPFQELPQEEAIISDDKILFLHSILTEAGIENHDKEKYILATMLVQTALDIHDFVAIQNADQTNSFKSDKQMTVLAGDLYSGLFYHILSNIEDIQMIGVLSRAIRDINERKMIIYQSDIHSINHLLEELKEVESALVVQVANYFEVSGCNIAIQNWLLMKRLSLELRLYQKQNQSSVIGLLTQRNTEQDVIRMFENMIPRLAMKLESYIDDLPAKFGELKTLLNQELKNVSWKQGLVLGEG
ncbi:heptaprenyl diphosphate synthase component 1 [Salinibacillus xinjiangensis]|uniref:Heptaprenyl diphosphate synthase n=1 Tax=Salinibacillus xinjiangensis TaxID=1229268 RepID=A0A6G1X639_9BACI|nr:heptaprenyl diphosphate synthase component 1 [Salinibacillus xinjiangensis]MRG86407.1 hypothetical protein [Salinibacillus xinjiangensis]